MEYASQPQEMTTIPARHAHTATVIFVHVRSYSMDDSYRLI